MISKTAVTLIGTPNVGKTSLFNYLTGEENLVANWDGVTTGLAKSTFKHLENVITINDLPGCYSLVITEQMSLEEKFVCEYINNYSQKDLFINLISIDNLSRDLYITLQLLEQGCDLIIVLNIHDSEINNDFYKKYQYLVTQLQNTLDCYVVCGNVITGFGMNDLKNIILNRLNNFIPKQPNILVLQKYIPFEILKNLQQYVETRSASSIGELIRFLEGDITKKDLQENIKMLSLVEPDSCSNLQQWDVFLASKRHNFIKNNFTAKLKKQYKFNVTYIARAIDNIALHKYFGLPIFCTVIYLMFFCVIQVGSFAQNYFDLIATTFFINPINSLLKLLFLPNWLLSILNDGLLVGMATLFKFIPILFFMHACLFVLENSGYIARAVFLVDRLMRFLGLSGKSLIPMIIGFGCNVPAILGARVIEQRRDRIITILMTPFMSCNARLVTYSVFATAFFSSNQGNIIFYLYVIGIISAICTGFLLQHILSGSTSNLIMELPNYSIPSLKLIFRKSFYKVKRFLKDSSLIIILVCIVIAGSKNINFLNNNVLNHVFFKYVMPIFKPMGIVENNWPAVVGLFSGLMAKEVIIGSLNAFYNSNNQNMLVGSLSAQFGNYKAAFAYLLFVLLSFPCVSVIAAIARELNAKWAIFCIIWTTVLAYVVAVFYYQIATFHEHQIDSIKLLSQIVAFLLITLLIIKIKTNHFKAKLSYKKNIPLIIN